MSAGIGEALLNLLFPPRCPLCHSYTEKKGGWCQVCLAKTINVRRVPVEVSGQNIFRDVWALGEFHSVLQDLIKGLKYKGQRAKLPYLHTFAAAAAQNLPADFWQGKTVVPVPLATAKEKARGFNQAELIFRPLAKIQGSHWLNALERSRGTRPQAGLSRQERRENLQGAFKIAADVQGRKILLVDDILTTGTTLRECAGELLRQGAAEVTALVLASDRK